jgi:hypothetical protein
LPLTAGNQKPLFHFRPRRTVRCGDSFDRVQLNLNRILSASSNVLFDRSATVRIG